jgi:hypothetical protein
MTQLLFLMLWEEVHMKGWALLLGLQVLEHWIEGMRR